MKDFTAYALIFGPVPDKLDDCEVLYTEKDRPIISSS
jgi:hypothetical protein